MAEAVDVLLTQPQTTLFATQEEFDYAIAQDFGEGAMCNFINVWTTGYPQFVSIILKRGSPFTR